MFALKTTQSYEIGNNTALVSRCCHLKIMVNIIEAVKFVCLCDVILLQITISKINVYLQIKTKLFKAHKRFFKHFIF